MLQVIKTSIRPKGVDILFGLLLNLSFAAELSTKMTHNETFFANSKLKQTSLRFKFHHIAHSLTEKQLKRRKCDTMQPHALSL